MDSNVGFLRPIENSRVVLQNRDDVDDKAQGVLTFELALHDVFVVLRALLLRLAWAHLTSNDTRQRGGDDVCVDKVSYEKMRKESQDLPEAVEHGLDASLSDHGRKSQQAQRGASSR